MLQEASLVAFGNSITQVFNHNEKLEWLLIPCTFYSPRKKDPPSLSRILKEDKDESYVSLLSCEFTHIVSTPIVLQRELPLQTFYELVKLKFQQCPATHEMALGATWLGGLKNTAQEYIDSEIFDGAPGLDLCGLPNNIKKHLDKFLILKTMGGHHFFTKHPAQPVRSPIVNKLIDLNWRSFRSENGGFIRISSNVKGVILFSGVLNERIE